MESGAADSRINRLWRALGTGVELELLLFRTAMYFSIESPRLAIGHTKTLAQTAIEQRVTQYPITRQVGRGAPKSPN